MSIDPKLLLLPLRFKKKSCVISFRTSVPTLNVGLAFNNTFLFKSNPCHVHGLLGEWMEERKRAWKRELALFLSLFACGSCVCSWSPDRAERDTRCKASRSSFCQICHAKLEAGPTACNATFFNCSIARDYFLLSTSYEEPMYQCKCREAACAKRKEWRMADLFLQYFRVCLQNLSAGVFAKWIKAPPKRL